LSGVVEKFVKQRLESAESIINESRCFGFAKEDKNQYDELRKAHIVLTNRDREPSIPRIVGTHKLHVVAGDPLSEILSADGTASCRLRLP
jgi:hypothetical protein